MRIMQAFFIIIQKGQSCQCLKASISFVHHTSNEVGCLQQCIRVGLH